MPRPDETELPDTPDTPTTDRALPPAGATAVARPGARGPAARSAPRPPTRTVGNGRPSTPEEARREIDRTRARMSSTLDALESRIVHERDSLERKKDELVDRATLKPLREKLSREPWRAVAIAFVAGYIAAAIRD